MINQTRQIRFCIESAHTIRFPTVRFPERQARLTKILKDAFDDKLTPKLVAIRAGAFDRC